MFRKPNLNKSQVRNFLDFIPMDLIPVRDFKSYSSNFIPFSSILPEAENMLWKLNSFKVVIFSDPWCLIGLCMTSLGREATKWRNFFFPRTLPNIFLLELKVIKIFFKNYSHIGRTGSMWAVVPSGSVVERFFAISKEKYLNCSISCLKAYFFEWKLQNSIKRLIHLNSIKGWSLGILGRSGTGQLREMGLSR